MFVVPKDKVVFVSGVLEQEKIKKVESKNPNRPIIKRLNRCVFCGIVTIVFGLKKG
jgi:hypothetical protein